MSAISLILAIVIIIYYSFRYYRIGIHLVPSFIVYNILFDVIGFIGDSLLIALLRAASTYLFFLIYFLKRGVKVYPFTILPILFIIYTTLIIPLSSDIFGTIRVHTRVASYFIFMVIAYDYFKNVNPNIGRFTEKLPYVLVVYIAYTLLANVIDLGTLYDRSYDDESVIKTGDIVGDFLLQISAAIVLLPLFNYYTSRSTKKYVYYLLIGIAILFLLVSARRSAPLIIVIGYTVYFILYRNRLIKIKYLLIIGLLSSIMIITFSDEILLALEARGRQSFAIEDIEKEKRTLEVPYVSYLTFSFDDPLNSIFGQDMYADKGVLPNAPITRPLHTDYARVLYGTGIIGFVIYYSFLFSILLKSIGLRKQFIPWDKNKLHFTTAMQLIIFKLAISYTGGFHVISFNALLFGLLGGIVGYMQYLNENNKLVP